MSHHSGLPAVLLAAAILILDPLREFPLQDDWAYFLSVEHFLRDGRFMVPDYTSATLVFQTFWGAAFAKIFGLSHSAVRLSTLALGFLSIFILGSMAAPGPRKVSPALGAPFLLFANPLFFLLCFTFLTDVPHLAWTLGALALAQRAERTDRTAWWVAASSVAALAYLVRQIGILIPAGILLHLYFRRQLNWRRAALVCAVPLAALAAHQYWFHRVHGSTLTFEIYRQATAAGLAARGKLAWNLYLRIGTAALYCALFSLPHLLALSGDGFKRPSKAAGFLGAIFLLPLMFWGDLFNMGILYRGGLGSPDISDPGAKVSGILGSIWFYPLLAAVGGAAFLGWLARRDELRAAWKSPGIGIAGTVLAFQFMAMLPGAIYTDRYMLPLVPLAGLLGWQVLRDRPEPEKRTSRVAILAGAAMFLASMLGTWDYLNWNDAKWAAGRAAVGLGIPAGRIFNGLDWCGTHFYEDNMRRLKAAKPLERIGYWEWLTTQRFDFSVAFSDSATAGSELLSVGYWTPLSLSPGRVAVRRVAPGARLP